MSTADYPSSDASGKVVPPASLGRPESPALGRRLHGNGQGGRDFICEEAEMHRMRLRYLIRPVELRVTGVDLADDGVADLNLLVVTD